MKPVEDLTITEEVSDAETVVVSPRSRASASVGKALEDDDGEAAKQRTRHGTVQ